MDFHLFPTTKPMSALLQATILRFVRHPMEQLGPQFAEILNTYAFHDGVPHGEVLACLHEKITRPPAAFQTPTIDSTKSLIPLHVARRLLQALQRFPQSCETERTQVEDALVQHLIEYIPPSSLAVPEMQQLWSVTAQCTTAVSRERLQEAFPLAATLPLQHTGDFMETLSLITAARPIADAEPASRLVVSSIGTEEVWRRVSEALQLAKSHVGRGGPLQPERVVPVMVRTCSMIGSWPFEAIAADEAAWCQHLPERMPQTSFASISALTLQLCALHSSCVPSFVASTAGYREALARDLWRHCTTKELEMVVHFLLKTLPSLERMVLSVRSVLRDCMDTALRLNLSQLATADNASPPTSPAAEDLTPEALVALGVMGSCLDCDPTMMTVVWAAVARRITLIPQHRWQPLMAAYLLFGLECASNRKEKEVTTELETVRDKCRTCLCSPEALATYGSARLVHTLLHAAPQHTIEMGLDGMALELLGAHADEGFSHAQLASLLTDHASPSVGWKMTEAVEERVRATAATLPVRA